MTSLDDGTLRVNAIHVGDGYHLVTCTVAVERECCPFFAWMPVSDINISARKGREVLAVALLVAAAAGESAARCKSS